MEVRLGADREKAIRQRYTEPHLNCWADRPLAEYAETACEDVAVLLAELDALRSRVKQLED